MQRTVCTWLLLLTLLGGFPASVAPQQPQDLKTIEEGLKTAMVGRVLTLRGFYRGGQLRFNSDGTLIDGGKPGPWTLYAKIQATDVRIKGQELQIEGRRLFLLYEEKKGWQQLNSGQTVTVKIVYPTPADLETEIRASLRKVFLAPDETIADVAPDYWRRFLRGEAERRNKGSLPPASERANHAANQELESQSGSVDVQRVRVSPGVQQARMIKSVEPRYPDVARRGGVQGEVRFDAVIAKDGRVKQLEVVQARGMGLEEAAIEAVSQWEYSPVVINGKPFEVQTTIIVRFRMY